MRFKAYLSHSRATNAQANLRKSTSAACIHMSQRWLFTAKSISFRLVHERHAASYLHFDIQSVGPRGGGGGGGVLWYFHTYVGSGYYLGFKILNFNILGGFQKNEFFWGMKILWIFFSGHHKIGLVWGSFVCIFGSFFACGALAASICFGIVIPSTWLSIYITYC